MKNEKETSKSERKKIDNPLYDDELIDSLLDESKAKTKKKTSLIKLPKINKKKDSEEKKSSSAKKTALENDEESDFIKAPVFELPKNLGTKKKEKVSTKLFDKKENKTKAVKVKETKTVTPKAEKSIAKEVSIKKNLIKEPKAEKPKVKEPLIKKTVTKEPKVKEPLIKKTTIKEPKIEEPKIKKTRSKKVKESEFKDIPVNVKRSYTSKKIFTLDIIITIVIMLCVCVGIAVLVFSAKLLEGKPEFDADKLRAGDSTVIYDCNGDEIIELGLYLRENIEYEDMPNCLIDAFLSIEDSRFFEHYGFDIPRFTKAILANLSTGSFGQGGSTITMQLVKNSYFQVDADGESTLAAASGMSGVKRKMQEIVLAHECNRELSKKETIALYINKINFGNNIRGVQKAAEYYFGKDASELNLVESCFLAGIINSPNNYNPYNELYKYNENYIYLNSDITYLENAQIRTAEVLDLMAYHGYITEEEAELAKSIKIEDLLVGIDEKFASYSTYYQDYIDVVIDEVTELTGKDPYTTSMKVYTSMDPYMQEQVYEIETEQTEIQYSNDLEQSALVVLNNQTGELIAIGGGRNQNQQARQFNRATSAYVQPGSSIKPILEYALAFDKLGWSTAHTITDMPYYLYGSDILMSNAGDQGYTGDMLITEAIARSLNTPAVQTLDAVIEEIDEEGVVEYLKSIGFTANLDSFDLQWAIGGNTCVCTPVQLAGAHAMLMNEGYYVTPHTVTKIEFFSGDEYVADTTGTQVLSSAAAFMTATCEAYNVSGEFYNLMQILKRDYPVYAKTGTTDYADSGVAYGIPVGSPKDMWMVAQTSNYTVTVWLGFDQIEQGAYFTSAQDMQNQKGKICKKLLDDLEEHFDYNPHAIEMPDDCTEVTFVKGAYPYAYSDGSYPTVTGYIKKSALEENPLVSVEEVYAQLDYKAGSDAVVLSGHVDGSTATVEIKTGGYWCSDGVQNISATNYNGKSTAATGRCYFPHYRTTESSPAYAHVTLKINDEYYSETEGEGYVYFSDLPEEGEISVCTDSGSCTTLYRN